jgi:hypothetical protein
MRLDIARPLTSLKGQPLVEGTEIPTVGSVLSNILAVLPADPGVPAGERKKRFVLAVRFTQSVEPVEIDDADVDLIRRLVNATSLAPFLSEQIMCALDERPNPLMPAKASVPRVPDSSVGQLNGSAAAH